MPALFGSLTALVLALSAWIAFKNKAEYNNQIALREKEEISYDKEVKEYNKIVELRDIAIAEKEAFAEKNEILPVPQFFLYSSSSCSGQDRLCS